jgi:hypothetical protein
VFTTRLEQALAAQEIDLAVHSLKDLPVDTGLEFTIGAVTSRTDPRDCLVALNAWTLATLPRGARVGTSSLRRQGQLLARRPDLVVKPIRGNVDTRVRKVLDGEYDAALLAAAGVTRLVKPALAYLDVIRLLRDRFDSHPLAAYNVSGEYAMIKAAAANRSIDERAAVLETLTAIKRAGADVIITYHAKEAAQWLK